MTTSDPKAFLLQFKKAKEEISRLKRDVPYIFHEWQALKAAEEEFEQARLKLQLAQQRWEKK